MESTKSTNQQNDDARHSTNIFIIVLIFFIFYGILLLWLTSSATPPILSRADSYVFPNSRDAYSQHIHYFYQTVKKTRDDASESGEKFETKIIEKTEMKKMKSPQDIYAYAQNRQTIEKPEKNENHDGSWMPTHSLDILSKTLTPTIFKNVNFFGDWSIVENLRLFLALGNPFTFNAVKIGTFWAFLAPKGNTGTQSDKEFSNNVEKPCLVDVTKFDPNANDYTMRSVMIGGFVFLNTSEYDTVRDEKTIYDVKGIEIRDGKMTDKRLDYIMKRMRGDYIKKHKGSGLIWIFYKKATKNCKAIILDVIILDEHGKHVDKLQTKFYIPEEKVKKVQEDAKGDAKKADLQIEKILKKLSDYQVKTNAEVRIKVNKKGECEIEEVPDFNGIEIYKPHVSRMRKDYSDLKHFDVSMN